MDLRQVLVSYRAGRMSRQTVIERFEEAGWDQSDVGLLLQNTNYDRGSSADLVKERLARQEQQRRQGNPLLPKKGQ